MLSKLAGSQFRPVEAQVRTKELVEGERLRLEPEPTNEYDPNAIKVLTEDDHFIGYLAAKDYQHEGLTLVEELAPMLAEGEYIGIVFSGIGTKAPYIDVQPVNPKEAVAA